MAVQDKLQNLFLLKSFGTLPVTDRSWASSNFFLRVLDNCFALIFMLLFKKIIALF